MAWLEGQAGAIAGADDCPLLYFEISGNIA